MIKSGVSEKGDSQSQCLEYFLRKHTIQTFRLVVESNLSNSLTQILIISTFVDTAEKIYYRGYTTSGWGGWKTVANVDNIPTKVSDLLNDLNFVNTSDSRLSNARIPLFVQITASNGV